MEFTHKKFVIELMKFYKKLEENNITLDVDVKKHITEQFLKMIEENKKE